MAVLFSRRLREAKRQSELKRVWFFSLGYVQVVSGRAISSLACLPGGKSRGTNGRTCFRVTTHRLSLPGISLHEAGSGVRHVLLGMEIGKRRLQGKAARKDTSVQGARGNNTRASRRGGGTGDGG